MDGGEEVKDLINLEKILRCSLEDEEYKRSRGYPLSEYRRKLENSGWIFYDRFYFYPNLDNPETSEKALKGIEIVSFTDLRKRMREIKTNIKISSLEIKKVKFARAYDLYGDRFGSDKLIADIYFSL